jgi:hypothetical protein
VVPSGSSTVKKPLPLTIRSLSLPVAWGLPCVWMRSMVTGRTPVPICMPEGSWVCWEDAAPGWRTFWYSRSSKTARDFLKPLVLTLARLLDTVSICVCWASMPVLAIQSERIICFLLSGRKSPFP